MGNQSGKFQHPNQNYKPKKNVHWKSAEIPSPPGRPYLIRYPNQQADVVNLRWERSENDGGSAIIGYIIECRRMGSQHWVRAVPSLVLHCETSIKELQPGWRYQFRIFAENVVGCSSASDLSDPLAVSLKRSSIISPMFTEELVDTYAVENNRVELKVCVIGHPSPDINWFKDGYEVFSNRRARISHNNNTSFLIIHQVALMDAGEIKCTATNRAGHAVTKSNLFVQAPPCIRLPRTYEDGLIVDTDDTLRLKVGIAGQPLPTITWMHEGKILSSSGRIEIANTERYSILKINKVQRSNRGEYVIKACNKLGEDVTSFLVTVTAPPSPPGQVRLKAITANKATLFWTQPSDDGGCEIGNYIVEYFRSGWNVWLKAVTTRSLSTTITDLIEGSEYRFRVKAENPFGLSDASIESEKLYIPHINLSNVEPKLESKHLEHNSKEIFSISKNYKLNEALFSTVQINNNIQKEKPTVERANGKKENTNSFKSDSSFHLSTQHKIISFKNESNQLVRENVNHDGKQGIEPNVICSSENITFESLVNKVSTEDEKRSLSPKNITNMEKEEKDSESNDKTNDDHLRNKLSVFVLNNIKENDKSSSFKFEFSDAIADSPFSISAPELATLEFTKMSSTPMVRHSVSSTELLYERAMSRFYEAVQKNKLEKKRHLHITSVMSLENKNEAASENDSLSLEKKFNMLFVKDLTTFTEDASMQKNWMDNKDFTASIGTVCDTHTSLNSSYYTDSTASSNVDISDKSINENLHLNSTVQNSLTDHPNIWSMQGSQCYANSQFFDFADNIYVQGSGELEFKHMSNDSETDKERHTTATNVYSSDQRLYPQNETVKKFHESEEQHVTVDYYSNLLKEISHSQKYHRPPCHKTSILTKKKGKIWGPEEEPQCDQMRLYPEHEIKDIQNNKPRLSISERGQLVHVRASPSDLAVSNTLTNSFCLTDENQLQKDTLHSMPSTDSLLTRRSINAENVAMGVSVSSMPTPIDNKLKGVYRKVKVSRIKKKSVQLDSHGCCKEINTDTEKHNNRISGTNDMEVESSKCDASKNLSLYSSSYRNILKERNVNNNAHSALSLTTDLVLFSAACYIYLFKDARLVIPILALLVYRQLDEVIKNYKPHWM